jgi:hypothetical protein
LTGAEAAQIGSRAGPPATTGHHFVVQPLAAQAGRDVTARRRSIGRGQMIDRDVSRTNRATRTGRGATSAIDRSESSRIVRVATPEIALSALSRTARRATSRAVPIRIVAVPAPAPAVPNDARRGHMSRVALLGPRR